MVERFKEQFSFGALLNAVLPGAGHLYWREYLFGTFVLLVMIIASVLFFFSFLVELPPTIKVVLFGLPIVFYGFTFVDLWRAVRRSDRRKTHSSTVALAFLFTSLIVCLIVPLSPVNFVIQNCPQIVNEGDVQLGRKSDGKAICLVDRSAYRVNLFFLDEPFPRRSPTRWDLVRYYDQSQMARTGLVLGFSSEDVTAFNDSLFVDGFAVDRPDALSLGTGGQVPLTHIDPGCILVATLNQGAIDTTYQISPRDVIGKVHRLF
jgi:hypothetical protein